MTQFPYLFSGDDGMQIDVRCWMLVGKRACFPTQHASLGSWHSSQGLGAYTPHPVLLNLVLLGFFVVDSKRGKKHFSCSESFAALRLPCSQPSTNFAYIFINAWLFSDISCHLKVAQWGGYCYYSHLPDELIDSQEDWVATLLLFSLEKWSTFLYYSRNSCSVLQHPLVLPHGGCPKPSLSL